MKLTGKENTEARAVNGRHVGNGYDVTIKRESDSVALVNLIHVATGREWLGATDVDAGQDLQTLAVEIANCPGDWIDSMASDDSDGWDGYAARWDAI